MPNVDEKHELLQYFMKKFNIPDDHSDLPLVKSKIIMEELSGAEIENICRELGMTVVRNMIIANSLLLENPEIGSFSVIELSK